MSGGRRYLACAEDLYGPDRAGCGHGAGGDDGESDGVSLVEGEEEIPETVANDYMKSGATLQRLKTLEPYQFEINLEPLRVRVTWDRQPDIRPNNEIGVKVTFLNQRQIYGNMPYFVSLRWLLPEGFTADGSLSVRVPHVSSHDNGTAEIHTVLRAGERVEAINRIALEVVIDGRQHRRICADAAAGVMAREANSKKRSLC